ncbi:MAG: outer membrane beta-barrel protein [Pseudobdellovibrio sp.]
MKTKNLLLILVTFLISQNSSAVLFEFGLSYGFQKKTFNTANYYQSENKSASFSVSFIEKLALEISHTDGFYESQESDSNSTRTVQQKTLMSDASLILILLDRQSYIQPYLKGGVAYIQKKQEVRYLNSSTITIPESNGWAPSYGAGLKFILSERFSIRLGYDVWQTPLSDGTKSDDSAFKAGMTWTI